MSTTPTPDPTVVDSTQVEVTPVPEAGSDNAPEVKCPVHGTHGALSHGKCWYCEQVKSTVRP